MSKNLRACTGVKSIQIYDSDVNDFHAFSFYKYINEPATVMETWFWRIGVRNDQHMQLCFKPSKLSIGLTKQNKDDDQEGKYFHEGKWN